MASTGTEYADTITDVQGGNTIYAGGGNDLIIARDEYIEEIIDGGEGMDTVSFINLERVNVNIGPVTMSYGYASQTGDLLFSIENVIGSNGGDGIKGNTGANELYGLAGGDVLEGGLGADLLSGGTGTDYAVYENSGARVAVDLGSGQGVGGEAEGDRLVSIENVFGSAYDDLLRGNAATNELRGNGGRDSLFGYDGNDWLSGGNGNDMLEGGRGADQLIGGAGADVFRFTATGDSYAMIGHQDGCSTSTTARGTSSTSAGSTPRPARPASRASRSSAAAPSPPRARSAPTCPAATCSSRSTPPDTRARKCRSSSAASPA